MLVFGERLFPLSGQQMLPQGNQVCMSEHLETQLMYLMHLDDFKADQNYCIYKP